MRWDPRVRFAHTVDILSTCTTTSTNLPTPQVESSLSWSRAMVYQQVTMVHLARYMPVWAWHISSKLHVRFIDHKLSIYSRPLTGIMTSFPTLDGNQDLIPDPWWESDFVWWTTTTTRRRRRRRRRFGSLYRRSLRLHLMEQGWSQVPTSIFTSSFIRRIF